MLAPKRVQEQYTSTRTTSKLADHGLLGDPEESTDRARRITERASAGNLRRNTSAARRENEKREKEKKEREKKQREKDEKAKAKAKKAKEKNRDMVESAESSSTAYSQASTVGTFSTKAEGKQRRHSAHQVRQVVVSLPSTEQPSTSSYEPSEAASSDTVRKHSSFESSRTGSLDHSAGMKATTSPRIAEHSEETLINPDAAADDDDEESMPVTRTPHAEAFTSLDPNVIEYVRSKGGNRMIVDGHSVHWTKRLLSGFGRPTKSIANAPAFPPGPSAAAIEATYTPPWMVVADRGAVETNEKLIQNLNDSFKDVGLLHTFKPPKQIGNKGKKKNNTGPNLFSKVPEDSLYMLLPLWPGETDKSSQPGPLAPPPAIVPIEERQYLLVYYIPFEEPQKDKSKDLVPKKKKAKTLSSPESSLEPMDSKTVCLAMFRVCGRLVGYDELRGSGVRLPNMGLSITGPMWEGMQDIPPASLRDNHPDDFVIGYCHGRSKGFEFVPEGLTRLGLAVLVAHTDNPREFEIPVVLTSIGRAAVEMIWLGCLALTSFGTA